MPGYISEFLHEGGASSDFVEIAIPEGTDTSSYTLVHYNSDGTVNATYSLGSVVTTINGQDVYLIDSSTPLADIKSNEAIALVDDTSTVLQFLTTEGNDVVATEGPANGLTSTNIGSTSGGESHQTNDGGSTYFAQSSPNPGAVPCYAPGTLIATPDSPRAVEALRVGDLVDTLDRGPMPIRWLRAGEQPLEGAAPDARPVLIRAGAFGPGRPARDLVVSPQHRILVGGRGQLAGAFPGERFAPAKALTGLPRIRFMAGKRTIIWHHFALETHAVVTANGCLSESLLLGPMVIGGLTRAQRRRLSAIFGPAPSGGAVNADPARACLSVRETQAVLSQRLAAVRRRAFGDGTDKRKAPCRGLSATEMELGAMRPPRRCRPGGGHPATTAQRPAP